MTRIRALTLGCLISLVLVAPGGAQEPAQTQTVATIDGERITLKELRQFSGPQLATLEEQVFKLQQQKLDLLIADRLLAREAKRRNTSLEALVATEISSKIAPVTPEEIHTFYEANKAQLNNKAESEIQEPIRVYLHNQRLMARRQEFVATLQSQARVSIQLATPEPFRAIVKGDGPTRGAANSPVTIVAFEDFHCPFCKQTNDTLDRVMARFKDQVRFVHRDFPLVQLHPGAPRAHEAARCAEKGGKFWEYRSLLYANAPAASPEQLNAYATKVGLDLAAFTRCLDSGASRATIQSDEAEGNRLGVQGTPAFFINGRLLAGAQPESEFARVIDEELRAHKSPEP